ncbi:hypothetical protein ACQKWADRAFT_280628 [Trichoderma austrokoningii]
MVAQEVVGLDSCRYLLEAIPGKVHQPFLQSLHLRQFLRGCRLFSSPLAMQLCHCNPPPTAPHADTVIVAPCTPYKCHQARQAKPWNTLRGKKRSTEVLRALIVPLGRDVRLVAWAILRKEQESDGGMQMSRTRDSVQYCSCCRHRLMFSLLNFPANPGASVSTQAPCLCPRNSSNKPPSIRARGCVISSCYTRILEISCFLTVPAHVSHPNACPCNITSKLAH